MISSPKNPRIKSVLALRDRTERLRLGLTRVEGFDEIRFAMSNGLEPEILFYCPELVREDRGGNLVEAVRGTNADVVTVTRRVFEHMAYREGADGWLAVFPTPERELAEVTLGPNPLILVAESVEKPGNLGALLRTAEAAGVDLVISANPVTDWGNPNVVRASKGAVFGVPIAQAGSEDAIAWLRQHNVRSVVTTPEAALLYSDLDLRVPSAIVVGAEDRGLDRRWLEAADVAVRIPMFGRIDSLNVAISGALLVYEAVRQRQAGQAQEVRQEEA